MPNPPQAAFLEALGWTILNSWWQFGLLWMFVLFLKKVLPQGSAAMRYNLSLCMLIIGIGWTTISFVLRLNSLADGNIHLISIADNQVHNGYLTAVEYLGMAMPYISMVYLLCLCFNLIRFSRLLHLSHQLKAGGLQKVPVELRLFLGEMAMHMNIRPAVQLWISEKIDTPLILGWIKPVILLPISAISQLNTAQLEAILIHELAHIKRNDYFWNILVALSEVIFYFNPFARWIIQEIRIERENSCDDWVLQFPYQPDQYAQALLKLEQQRIGRQSQLMLAARGSNRNLLLCRVKRMLRLPVSSQEGLGQLKIMSVLAIFLCLLSFFEPRREIGQFFQNTIEAPLSNYERGYKIVAGVPLQANIKIKSAQLVKAKPAKINQVNIQQVTLPENEYTAEGMLNLLAVDNDNTEHVDEATQAVLNVDRAYSLVQGKDQPAKVPVAQHQLPYIPRSSFQALKQQDSIIPQAALIQKLSMLQDKDADLQAKLAQVQDYWQNIKQEKMADLDLAEQYNLKKSQLQEMQQQVEKQARQFEQLIEKQAKMVEEQLLKTPRKRKVVHI